MMAEYYVSKFGRGPSQRYNLSEYTAPSLTLSETLSFDKCLSYQMVAADEDPLREITVGQFVQSRLVSISNQ